MKLLTCIAVLALAGCSKSPEAPSASLPRADAKRAAQAVATVTGGTVCAVAPTGSMVPTFADNDYLVTEAVDLGSVRIGDIIVRKDGKGGALIVHRVVKIGGGQLVTRGDANSFDDPGTVTTDTISGRVVAIVYGAK